MLTIIFGGNERDAEKVYQARVSNLREQFSAGRFIIIDPSVPNEAPDAGLAEYALAQGMFGDPAIITGRGMFDDEELAEIIKNEAKTLTSSPNHFIFLESKLPVAISKSLRASGAELMEFALSVRARQEIEWQEKKRKNEIFKLTDALGERDRKRLWILYHSALLRGLDPEEVYWKFIWQIKTVLLSMQTKSASEAGLHPFVYQKARQAAGRFGGVAALGGLFRKLLNVWSATISGRTEISLGLEQFILNI